jgi:sortase A
MLQGGASPPHTMRRLASITSTALITAGLVIGADVALTLLWKEPLSTAYGSLQQNSAETQLEDLQRRFPSSRDLRVPPNATPKQRVSALVDRFAREVRGMPGTPIGRIAIPEIDLDVVMVEGVDTASLRKGPGHYTPSGEIPAAEGDGSAFPGQGKTVGIAGHRTTYLAPFRRLNELKKGDEVTLEMPYATFAYSVEKTKIVDPSAVEVVENAGYERVVLTACHPLYSAAQRIVVFARLERISLFASDARIWQDP